jgi:hypothetical protein
LWGGAGGVGGCCGAARAAAAVVLGGRGRGPARRGGGGRQLQNCSHTAALPSQVLKVASEAATVAATNIKYGVTQVRRRRAGAAPTCPPTLLPALQAALPAAGCPCPSARRRRGRQAAPRRARCPCAAQVASALSQAPSIFKGMSERISFRGGAQAGAATEAAAEQEAEQGSSSAAVAK